MQKIHVRNFMAIQDAELKIDQVLLLIGEQASGKSTIAKLIYYFQSLSKDLLRYLYLYADEEEIFTDQDLAMRFWAQLRKKFYNYFGSTRHLEPFEVRFTFPSVTNRYIDLKLENGDLKIYLSFQPQLFNQRLLELLNLLRENALRQTLDQDRLFRTTWQTIEQHVTGLFGQSREPFYLPAGRLISVNFPDVLKMAFASALGGELGVLESNAKRQQPTLSPSVDLYLMAEFLNQTERTKSRFKNNDFEGLLADRNILDENATNALLASVIANFETILKGKYRQDQYGEKIFYADGHYVDLNDASSGQQESIRILQDIFLILLDKQSVFRVLEEPEAHLYPLAQKQLLELIALMLNETNSQIVITTHSPYILSVFNNLLYATRVAQINPQSEPEIGETISPRSWLQPEHFYAYVLKNHRSFSIFDKQLGLIDQNALDEISDELGSEFDALYSLRAGVPR